MLEDWQKHPRGSEQIGGESDDAPKTEVKYAGV